MKAILCHRFGTPGDLVLADIPDPVAGPGEIVAKVEAVGLNFFDTLIIAGKYQTKPPFPFSPGGEFAGVVESIGPGVTGFAPGDRVMGYTNFNAARERTAVSASSIVKLADGLDFERAAALTITYGTAYYALKHRAHLQANERLAVLGAAGGGGLAVGVVGRLHGAAEGSLPCHIQKTYSLAETPVALKALADRKVMGKLVVRCQMSDDR